MPLVTTKEILLDAQKNKYAVGAFNVENMEMVQAVVSAAVELKSPAILQTTPSTLKYGSSYDLAMSALNAGYTSIMIDGSHSSFEENIEITKSVVLKCHEKGIPVEAELGKVGGKEDDLDGGEGDLHTNPKEAAEFVEKTGIDSLAIAIGTAHGVYKGTPKIDKERLSEIKAVVSIPLVLHGTSGVPDEDVIECVKRGICKVNYATDLRIAFSKGLKEVLAKDPDVFDPKKYNAAGREEVKKYVMQKMQVVGSVNKA